MPRFAANIGDSWLYSHLPFLERIGAAAKDGFKAVECGSSHYALDPKAIKAELDKHDMQWVLLNTHSMPKYAARKDRKYHAIYPDEVGVFRQSMLRAFDYAMVLNKEMCIHIDIGMLTEDVDAATARKQLVSNLKMVQKLLDDDAENEQKYKGNQFTLMIEPVNNIKGRGIENYFLWSQFEALSIIKAVNDGYSGSYPIYLQYDFFHAQCHHGDITSFLKQHVEVIRHIQVSQCPNRDEACNATSGDLNFDKLYQFLDEEMDYPHFVGLEYHPMDSKDTAKGLRMDNDWFGRWNVTRSTVDEDDDGDEKKEALPVTDTDAVKKMWEGMGDFYKGLMAQFMSPTTSSLMPHLHLNRAATGDGVFRMLDVATGDGFNSVRIIKELIAFQPKGFEYHGIDIASEMVKNTKETIKEDKMLSTFLDHHNKDDQIKIDVAVRNGENLKEFGDGTIDRYLASLCLNLTGNASKMVREAFRVLKPKGISAWSIWGDRNRGKVFESYGPITPAVKKELGLKELDDQSAAAPGRSNYYLGADMESTVKLFKSAGFTMVFWWSVDVALPVQSAEPWINKFVTAPSFQGLLNQSKDDKQRAKVIDIASDYLRKRFKELVVEGNEGITHNNICIIASK